MYPEQLYALKSAGILSPLDGSTAARVPGLRVARLATKRPPRIPGTALNPFGANRMPTSQVQQANGIKTGNSVGFPAYVARHAAKQADIFGASEPHLLYSGGMPMEARKRQYMTYAARKAKESDPGVLVPTGVGGLVGGALGYGLGRLHSPGLGAVMGIHGLAAGGLSGGILGARDGRRVREARELVAGNLPLEEHLMDRVAAQAYDQAARNVRAYSGYYPHHRRYYYGW